MFGSIGMPELMIIFVIALIIFGPRKLPELGRSLGRSLTEFKRASNELRSTLEAEIRVEETPPAAEPKEAEIRVEETPPAAEPEEAEIRVEETPPAAEPKPEPADPAQAQESSNSGV